MMAIQHSVSPGPSWDETIVPALRKRLESESRTLAKRMSAISMVLDDPQPRPPVPAVTDTSPPERTNIPRPRFSRQRPADISTASQPTPTSSKQKPFRSRTLSQPPAVDPRIVNGKNAKGAKSSNRNMTVSPNGQPTTPSSPKPHISRIPKVAHIARTGSIHSNTDHSFALSSPSPIQNEPPPFSPTSPPFTPTSAASRRSTDSESEERPFEHWYRGEVSRNGGVGELRVGKRMEMLDIANYGHGSVRRMPSGTTRVPASPYGTFFAAGRRRAGSWDRGRDGDSFMMEQEKARHLTERVMDESPLTDLEVDSLETHESQHYVEVRARGGTANGTATPLPPLPPSSDELSSQYHPTPPQHQFSQSSAAISNRSTTPSANTGMMPQYNRSASPTSMTTPTLTPTPTARATPRQGTGPSRIPTPTTSAVTQARQGSEPPPSSQPTTYVAGVGRAGSEPPLTFSPAAASGSGSGPRKHRRPSEGSSVQSLRSMSQPHLAGTPTGIRGPSSSSIASPTLQQQQGQSQQQRRAANGAIGGPSSSSPSSSSPPSASKKPKTITKKTVATKLRGEERDRKKDRRSVAEYPAPQGVDGEELMDAIPTWTRPVEEGNWDEVVLPVVARKKGLEGQYERVGGTLQPKKQNSEVFAPQPGTFGIDHSKHKPPDGSMDGPPDRPPDEFGKVFTPQLDTTVSNDAGQGPKSPPPFSQYAPGARGNGNAPDVASQEEQLVALMLEEEKGAGCCKCIIM